MTEILSLEIYTNIVINFHNHNTYVAILSLQPFSAFLYILSLQHYL